MLGVSTHLALSGQSDLVQAKRMSRMSTQDNVARAADQIAQRNLGMKPTISALKLMGDDVYIYCPKRVD